MRNLAAGNKVNFTVFTIIVIVIMLILAGAVILVLSNAQEDHEISSSTAIYDNNYNYIELENTAVVSKKWNGNYYLKENETKKEYNLGKYSVQVGKCSFNFGNSTFLD